jgi:mono/diheme cytochrome c family protein
VEPALSEVERVPLYVTLNLDIDAPHDALFIPTDKPLAVSGEKLATNLPISQFTNYKYYRAHSPYQTFEELNKMSLTESQRWDLVAYIWHSNTTSASLANGQRLYAQNCAACHGEQGVGDGVFANDLKTKDEGVRQAMLGVDNMTMQGPAIFTNPKRMLGASPALLQGKILRGGMGTGMPMWGSIFTEDQIWNLIAYLYSFQFEYQGATR